MIKVIKQGKIPKDRTYEAKCTNCRCEVEFTQKSPGVSLILDQRDGDFLQLRCPTCGQYINRNAVP